jgi:hypothetical protein
MPALSRRFVAVVRSAILAFLILAFGQGVWARPACARRQKSAFLLTCYRPGRPNEGRLRLVARGQDMRKMNGVLEVRRYPGWNGE